MVGPAGTHIVMACGGLQHGGEDAIGEGEPRGPEQGGGRAPVLAHLLILSIHTTRFRGQAAGA